jgi:hypothetical protein
LVADYEYPRVEIALLTGWTLEYIDNLGMIDQESVLQIYEAKQKLRKVNKNGR